MKYCCEQFKKARTQWESAFSVVYMYNGKYIYGHDSRVIDACPWCGSAMHPEEDEDYEASKHAVGAEATS